MLGGGEGDIADGPGARAPGEEPQDVAGGPARVAAEERREADRGRGRRAGEELGDVARRGAGEAEEDARREHGGERGGPDRSPEGERAGVAPAAPGPRDRDEGGQLDGDREERAMHLVDAQVARGLAARRHGEHEREVRAQVGQREEIDPGVVGGVERAEVPDVALVGAPELVALPEFEGMAESLDVVGEERQPPGQGDRGRQGEARGERPPGIEQEQQ